ncbi:hypothetical protein ACPV47_16150 [Vibrio jasicida]|uniref:hypothetical protein n=1 Tax=Vibrio jasicida TaxID=766224 RepID=UPI004068611E
MAGFTTSTDTASDAGKVGGARSKRGKAKKTLFNERLDGWLKSDKTVACIEQYLDDAIHGKHGEEVRDSFMNRIFESRLNVLEKEANHSLKISDMKEITAYKEIVKRMTDDQLKAYVVGLDKESDDA